MPACRLEDTLARPILPLRVGGQHLILVRDGDALFACERACPHEQADLARGRCAAGKLLCPRHRAWLDLADGRVSGGWTFRPLRTHAVRVEAGQVLVSRDPVRRLGAGPG